MLGVLPRALRSGRGFETRRSRSIAVIGDFGTATLLELLAQPFRR